MLVLVLGLGKETRRVVDLRPPLAGPPRDTLVAPPPALLPLDMRLPVDVPPPVVVVEVDFRGGRGAIPAPLLPFSMSHWLKASFCLLRSSLRLADTCGWALR